MLRRLELSQENHFQLLDQCKSVGIDFLSTAFDLDSLALLKSLGIRKWKIPSGEITNLPFLRAIGKMGQEIILSTGMAKLGEIEDAISAIERAGTSRNQITLLHCSTEYPAPFNEINLRAINTLSVAFGVEVGYSDHSTGIEIPIAAVALGACLIEKHFTLDKTLPGPDHKASLDPSELRMMVKSIRNIEVAMGDGIKTPMAAEVKNIPIARKSIVASMKISKGECFSEDNITTKRPGTGRSPMEWDTIIGAVAERDYDTDEFI
jgi:N,N'-diacetyllegionaminate synthase